MFFSKEHWVREILTSSEVRYDSIFPSGCWKRFQAVPGTERDLDMTGGAVEVHHGYSGSRRVEPSSNVIVNEAGDSVPSGLRPTNTTLPNIR